jgi:glycosyltransferase involved in cell wall biosynthesis
MISIITPVWNGANTIAKCIKSVSSQVNADYEHIIIDGGSTDDTIAICENNYHSRMCIITNRDKWIYEKMNDGIRIAKGEWIYFISADDVFITNNVLELFECYAKQFKDNDIIYGDIFSERLNKIVDGKFGNIKVLTRNVPVMFYRKTLFNKMGYFNVKYKYLADYDFTMKCWLSGKVAHKYVPLITISYADGGVSSTRKDLHFKADHFINCVKYISNGNWSIQYKTFLLFMLPLEVIKKKANAILNSIPKQSNHEIHDRLIRERYLR